MSMKPKLKETPSQTAGPYVHIGTLPAAAGIEVATHDTPNSTRLTEGDPMIIRGVIRDGAGDLVKDAMVEIWQAGADGSFGASGHTGWARSYTDYQTGEYQFETVKPGRVDWIDGTAQAPHITLLVFARGINIHLQTRIYFADEEATNEEDPVLSSLAEGKDSLLACPNPSSNNAYRFDVVLQGEGETVFFDV